MFPELAEELRPGQRSLVAGHLGPEGLHERRRPGSRDAEELLEIAAGEEVRSIASSWRMASGMARSHRGVAGIGERRVGYNPCGECDLGRCTARRLCSRLVDGRLLVKIRSGGGGAGGGSHKGSYGTVRTGDGPKAVTGGRRAHTGRPAPGAAMTGGGPVAARPHLSPVPDHLPGRPTSDPGGPGLRRLYGLFSGCGVAGAGTPVG